MQVRHGEQRVAQSGPRRHGLHSLLHTEGARQKPIVTGTLTAAGPGRSPSASKRVFPDAGTQRMPAKVVSKSPEPLLKRGVPVSRMVPASPPKAPGFRWPGQKLPAGSDTDRNWETNRLLRSIQCPVLVTVGEKGWLESDRVLELSAGDANRDRLRARVFQLGFRLRHVGGRDDPGIVLVAHDAQRLAVGLDRIVEQPL